MEEFHLQWTAPFYPHVMYLIRIDDLERFVSQVMFHQEEQDRGKDHTGVHSPAERALPF